MKELDTLSDSEIEALRVFTDSQGFAILQKLLNARVESLRELSMAAKPGKDINFEYDHGFWAGQYRFIKEAMLTLPKTLGAVIEARDAIAKRQQ